MQEVTHRTCNVCGIEKPVAELVASKRYIGGYMPLCKPCRNDYWKTRHANNPKARQAHIDRVLRSKMLHAYGMVAADYDRMLKEQNGRCKLCRTDHHGRKDRFRYWNIDHDHNTGRVRGLLCHSCNVTLGKFEKMLERVKLKEILDYIRCQQ